ncbi:hypothetical protein TIFTF001_029026 [Ficus carica]|uniref:Aminotransferase-like plant mobile domain-containing protein n=1 Tax=Ficus carica TaxID=3494 RepID=A0AA88DR45_FICCA|nr:hypothetical protein TIFTF001_029026 [Ficus carica]
MLTLLLGRFVFLGPPCDTIQKSLFPMAISLAQGKKLSVAPLFLGQLYRNLDLLPKDEVLGLGRFYVETYLSAVRECLSDFDLSGVSLPLCSRLYLLQEAIHVGFHCLRQAPAITSLKVAGGASPGGLHERNYETLEAPPVGFVHERLKAPSQASFQIHEERYRLSFHIIDGDKMMVVGDFPSVKAPVDKAHSSSAAKGKRASVTSSSLAPKTKKACLNLSEKKKHNERENRRISWRQRSISVSVAIVATPLQAWAFEALRPLLRFAMEAKNQYFSGLVIPMVPHCNKNLHSIKLESKVRVERC